MRTGMRYSQFNHIVPVPNTHDHAIINFGTGTVARLNPFTKKLFDFAMQLPEDHPLILSWKKAGFLTDIDEIEAIRENLRTWYQSYLKSTDEVLRLTLYVTSACNFSCPYCFEDRRCGPMSKKVQEALVRYAERKLATGKFKRMVIGWFGGEPLLEPGLIEELGGQLMEVSSRYGVGFSSNIHTNGYLLDQNMVDMLERVNCRFALITIDGVGQVHDATRHLRGGDGSYDTIIKNLSGIRTNMTINIRSNLHAHNYNTYDELCQVIRDIAKKTGNRLLCSPARVHDSPAGEKRGDTTKTISLEQYSRIVAKTDLLLRSNAFARKSCACHIFSFNDYVIDELGNVYSHCNEYAVDPSRAYCNILDLDGSNDEQIEEKHRAFCIQEILPERYPKCMNCKLLPVCCGGCMARRLMGSGEPVCPDRLYDPDAYVLRRYYEMLKKNV